MPGGFRTSKGVHCWVKILFCCFYCFCYQWLRRRCNRGNAETPHPNREQAVGHLCFSAWISAAPLTLISQSNHACVAVQQQLSSARINNNCEHATRRSTNGRYISEDVMKNELKWSEHRIRSVKRRCLADKSWKVDLYEALATLLLLTYFLHSPFNSNT